MLDNQHLNRFGPGFPSADSGTMLPFEPGETYPLFLLISAIKSCRFPSPQKTLSSWSCIQASSSRPILLPQVYHALLISLYYTDNVSRYQRLQQLLDHISHKQLDIMNDVKDLTSSKKHLDGVLAKLKLEGKVAPFDELLNEATASMSEEQQKRLRTVSAYLAVRPYTFI